jgi:diaminopimelate epimerase
MNLPFPIPFSKMSGTGNDFIIIDHRRQFLGGVDLPVFARAVCRRKFSVGADCAARFAYENGIAPAAMRFNTLAGTIEASVNKTDHRSVKVRLTSPQNCVLDQQV